MYSVEMYGDQASTQEKLYKPQQNTKECEDSKVRGITGDVKDRKMINR